MIETRTVSPFDDALDRLVEILKEEGATRILLFGSASEGARDPGADIDVACDGIANERFYDVIGRVMTEVPRRVDIVNLSRSDRFTDRIRRKGILLYER